MNTEYIIECSALAEKLIREGKEGSVTCWFCDSNEFGGTVFLSAPGEMSRHRALKPPAACMQQVADAIRDNGYCPSGMIFHGRKVLARCPECKNDVDPEEFLTKDGWAVPTTERDEWDNAVRPCPHCGAELWDMMSVHQFT